MTRTILNLFFIGVFLMIAYTVFTLVRSMKARRYFLPVSKKDWSSLVGDTATVGASIFLLFILQKNYQEPMISVMQFKGKELPDFQFYNIKTGRAETLALYRDKTVILNIWATWCGPCRREMPELEKLYMISAKDGVEVIAISDEDPAVIKRFLQKNPNQFNTAWFLQSNDLINNINTRPVSILIVNGLVKDIVIGGRGLGFFQSWVAK